MRYWRILITPASIEEFKIVSSLFFINTAAFIEGFTSLSSFNNSLQQSSDTAWFCLDNEHLFDLTEREPEITKILCNLYYRKPLVRY